MAPRGPRRQRLVAEPLGEAHPMDAEAEPLARLTQWMEWPSR